MSRQQKWVPELEKTLRDMWTSNTAKQIAQALHERHGVTMTRNCVIAKAHRLSLKKLTTQPDPEALSARRLERSNRLFLIAAAKETRQ